MNEWSDKWVENTCNHWVRLQEIFNEFIWVINFDWSTLSYLYLSFIFFLTQWTIIIVLILVEILINRRIQISPPLFHSIQSCPTISIYQLIFNRAHNHLNLLKNNIDFSCFEVVNSVLFCNICSDNVKKWHIHTHTIK